MRPGRGKLASIPRDPSADSADAFTHTMTNTPRSRSLEILLLVALGWFLVVSNPWLTVFDDEAALITDAAAPLHQTLRAFWEGSGLHEHPPLFDLFLHFWLRSTGGAFAWLRLPSILFYLAGLWFLARVAARLGGERSARSLLWLGTLWPYGFHYGRIAAWYSLCFLLVAALTLAYLRYAETLALRRWVAVILLAAALVCSNYFGWAILACLAIDLLWRQRGNLSRVAAPLLAGGFLLAVLYIPLWRVFWQELRGAPHLPHSLSGMAALGGFSLYTAFVSESVAPWFWALGIPAGLSVIACLLITLKYAPAPARRFLFYGFILFASMTVLGIVNARRLLPVAAWLLLPIAVTLASLPRGLPRKALAATLAGFIVIGWVGIYERRYYAAPRFLEPWQRVAEKAALRANSGSLVIGNNPSFLFYLTYALRVPERPGGWRFAGAVAWTIRDPRVFNPQHWAEAGHPLRPQIYFVRGAPGPLESGPAWDAEQWLDRHCRLSSQELLLPDPATHLKVRFIPQFGEMPWRVRIREYACPAEAGAAR
jgi:Dolichyl-phosphate-mannose-protein mannosyltransferase